MGRHKLLSFAVGAAPASSVSHTSGHLDCIPCEANKLAVFELLINPDLPFIVAFPIWLGMRASISEQTKQDYKRYAKAVGKFFGSIPLRDIHIGMLRSYQAERSKTAGPVVVNKEIGTLLQVRRRAKIIDELEEWYEPLPVPYWQPPKTISDDVEQAFLRALASRPQWELAYNYAVLSLHTGATGCELRGLKVSDIDLINSFLYIRREHVKNKYRVRKIPLVSAALVAARRLLEIAASKGSVAPFHCVLPFRICTNHYDPMRAASRSLIRKPWDAARKMAGCPEFTPHGARHQVNTKLFESGADDMTVQSMMGHQSRQMSEHYSSIRDERKRQALEAAFSAPKTGRWDVKKRA